MSADAQFQWMKKKPVLVRYSPLQQAHNVGIMQSKIVNPAITANIKFERSQFSYDVTEAALMKSLYHTLRFHMHSESIDNFNSLIALYLEQQRYSEAKWYFLQINYLARQKGDDANTIASLVGLGMVKLQIGDFAQAKDDLNAAIDFAAGKGRLNDVNEIKKKLLIVEHNRSLNIKNDIRYAELAEEKKN
ncbi:tetratricopeptide repeat protein [Mucilaginibacter sp. AW1-3]